MRRVALVQVSAALAVCSIAVAGRGQQPSDPYPQCAQLQGKAYQRCVLQELHNDEDKPEKQDEERKEKQRAQTLARLAPKLKAAGITLPPNTLHLPAPDDAAMELRENGSPTTDEIEKARKDARAMEVKAIKAGLTEIVWPGEVNAIMAKEQAKDEERAAKKLAEHEEQEAQERANKCPHGVQAGMTLSMVHICLGWPDYTNSDFYSDQLVYPHGTYVYIDRRTGRVENVQWTH